MISMYIWKKVREMYFNEKKGIKRIARVLKISKNTVKKYIKTTEEPKYNLKSQRKKKLNDYESVIREGMDRKLIGTAIYAKLKEAGYQGSLVSVYRYLKYLEYESSGKEVVSRFETLPGEQMQYDWKEWDLKINDKTLKIYVHCLILSYSRKKYFTFSLDKSSSSVINAVIKGFEYFNGYCENMVIDNAKSMILNHNTKKRAVEFSDDFLLFTGKYNIKPYACYPYRPKTKGKVERPFFYLEEHLLKFYDFNSIEDFEIKLNEFIEKYNSKEHSAFSKPPNEVFELEEKNQLKKYQIIDLSSIFIKETRLVSPEGYISLHSNYYPVPMKYCNKKLFIENIMGVDLNIYGPDMKIIISHKMIQFKKNHRMTHPEHETINKVRKENLKKIRSDNIFKFMEKFNKNGEKFIRGLEKVNGINCYYHLSCLLDFVDIYGQSAVENAINNCVEINAFHKDSIKAFLSKEIPKVNYRTNEISIVPLKDKIKYDLTQYKYLEGVC